MYLETKSVSKSYDGRKIIEDINITVEKGELVCLLGISGSGKTTLFNIVSGLEKPDCGKVFLGGEDITAIPGRVSYMLQKDLLLPFYTVLDNVCLPLIIKKGMKKKEARERAKGYFSVFGIEGTEDKYPAALSGGMKQRVSLARAFLKNASVLLLDEPTKELDEDLVDTVLSIIKEEGERKLVILVSHSPKDAEKLGATEIFIQ
jgi:ABC-type nitrate/sulfonate/bicarbonate transport system ATPase subunit